MPFTENQRFQSYWLSLFVLLSCLNSVLSLDAINESKYLKDTDLKKYQNRHFDPEAEKNDETRLSRRSLDYVDGNIDDGLERIPDETLEDFDLLLEAARRGFGLPFRRAGPYPPSARRVSPMMKALITMPERNPHLYLHPATKIVAKVRPHLLRVLGIVHRLHGLVHQSGRHSASAESADSTLKHQDVLLKTNVRNMPVAIDNDRKETRKSYISDKHINYDGKNVSSSEQKANTKVAPVVYKPETQPLHEKESHMPEHGDLSVINHHQEKTNKDVNITIASVQLLGGSRKTAPDQVSYLNRQYLKEVNPYANPVLTVDTNNDVLRLVKNPTVLKTVELVSKRSQPRRTRLEIRQKREEMNTKNDITPNEAFDKQTNARPSLNNVHKTNTNNQEDAVKNDKSYIRRLVRSNPSAVPMKSPAVITNGGKGMTEAAGDVHNPATHKKEDAKTEVVHTLHANNLHDDSGVQKPASSGDTDGGNIAQAPEGNHIVELTVDTNVTDDISNEHQQTSRHHLSSASMRALAFLGLFLFIMCFILAIITKSSCEGPRRTSSSMQLYSRNEPTTSYWT